MNLQSEIARYMRAQGYWVKRQAKHIVWTNGVNVITTAVSPSCHHALANIKRDVERANRQQPNHERRAL